jgi:hypothetical protein
MSEARRFGRLPRARDRACDCGLRRHQERLPQVATARDFDFAEGGIAEFSLEAWIKPAGKLDGCFNDCRYQYVFDNTDGTLGGYSLYFTENERSVSFSISDQTAQSGFPADAGPAKEVWLHVVAVREKTRMVTYINNIEVPGPQTNIVLNSRNSELRIGKLSIQNNWYYLGAMDELAIYDRALTALEVAEHYVTGIGK